MVRLKNRKTPLSSKRKLISMVKLYEQFVDEPIKTIDPVNGYIQSDYNNYSVNISTNKVKKVYPDWTDD